MVIDKWKSAQSMKAQPDQAKYAYDKACRIRLKFYSFQDNPKILNDEVLVI